MDPAVNPLVEEALDQHAGPVDGSRVVTDISGNTVTLIGQVRTEAQRAAVVRAAWRGDAVMAVVDQIEITG
jgi:osmotically-inducible protein OsmY